MTKAEALKELVRAGKKIAELGYVIGPGGNTSVRCGKTVYIKASGASFEDCDPKDYVGVDINSGELVDGKRRPSCETLAHIACMQAANGVGAVVHCHPIYVLAWGMGGKMLRASNPEMVAIIGSDVPVMKYTPSAGAPFAKKLQKYVKEGYKAVIIQNHGIFVTGDNIRQALYRTRLIEDGIKTMVAAKILGKIRYMTSKEWKEIDNAEFEDYRRTLLKMKG